MVLSGSQQKGWCLSAILAQLNLLPLWTLTWEIAREQRNKQHMALQTLLGCSKHPSPEQLCLVSNKITFKRLIPSGLDENLEISMLLSVL